jgi:hypothetical protein
MRIMGIMLPKRLMITMICMITQIINHAADGTYYKYRQQPNDDPPL